MQSIVRKLLVRGVKPVRLDSGTELIDPVIWITESIYIQVGEDYVVVFRSRLNELATYNCSMHIEDIMNKLRQAVDDGR